MAKKFNSQQEHDAYVEEKQKNRTIWGVIMASSLGTLIEWYDFYIFGSLAVVLATKFFPADNPTAAFLSTLATFAAGFVVRPFGALFFGRLGDIIGRKYTFLVTLLIMGFSTFLIGCVPSYETIGFVAPVLVLILRLLQGLALGGEYGADLCGRVFSTSPSRILDFLDSNHGDCRTFHFAHCNFSYENFPNC